MAETEIATFGALLRRHRLAAGLTQEALAERAGLSARAVSDLERDAARTPRLESVALLAAALGLAADQQAALRAAARPEPRGEDDRGASPAGAPRSLPASPPPLAGRARELAALRERLAATLAGAGGLVLLGGEAGIGKTALAEALCAAAAARGALVLVGRCYDLGETPPYGPWLDALARYPRDPALPPLPAPLAERGRLGPVAGRDALFAQVQDFLAAVAATRPLVLLLEDLHWADPGSLDLLRFLARDLADAPLLLLATYRADELSAGHPLAALVPRLVREAHAARLDLRPLDTAAVRALVAARYPVAEPGLERLVAYLQGRAEGNPFFLGELLRALEEEATLRPAGETWALGDLAAAPVPPLLRQVIAERAARLGDEARRLLALAAVIGQEVPLALWQAVADVDEAALLEAVERAVEAHLLAATPDGAGVRFAHALAREALYAGLLPPRRRALHRRIAEALLALPAPDPDAVAYHFRQAGDARAYAWLVRAGERAQAAYAWLTAAERFAAALALPGAAADPGERGWLLLRLAWLRRHQAPDRGVADLDAAEWLGTEAGDAVLTAYATFSRGLLRCQAGDRARGLPEMMAGIVALDALAPADEARLGRLQVRFGLAREDPRGTLALELAAGGRLAAARPLAEAVVARPPAGPAGARMGGSGYADAHEALGIVRALAGRPAAARDAFARAREVDRAVGELFQFGGTLSWELEDAVLPYQADRVGERRRLAAAIEAALARAAGARDRPPALDCLPLLLVEGRWAEARRLWPAAWASGTAQTLPGAALAALARGRGEPAAAWAVVRAWLPAGAATAPEDGARHCDFPRAARLLREAAALALDAGDLPTARAWLACHDRWLAWSGAVLGRAEGALGWAEYHRAAGDLALAQEHAAAALAHATDPRQPLALLAAHRLLGELAAQAGRHAEAATHLAEALALADACEAPYERALTLLALAELRAVTGGREAAESALAAARALLDPLEAKPALARADALAARLAAPAAPPAAYPAGLSTREVEVLRLVAAGLTDAQVAARLFVSRHTVNAHLRAIYGKLGVTSRAAATRFALEHDLA
ncbi:MAG TPA: AAA family ATPase [Thermomicrobiales bacterium]|nr:AAA family ATPase [Thermomicrobiales bacterium]